VFTECQLSTASDQGTRCIDGKFLSGPVIGVPRLGREWSPAPKRALMQRGAADHDSVKKLQGGRGLVFPSARPETCGGAAFQVDPRDDGAPPRSVARLLATLQA
jgi:hypothetical protein